jgi:hypothetical protein
MKIALNQYILLVVFSLFAVSCNDFLNELPQTSRSTVNFYKTEADFTNATVGLYSTLKSNGLYGNGGSGSTTNQASLSHTAGSSALQPSLLYLTEVVSDNATLGTTKNVATLSQFEIEEFDFSLSNTIISAAWTGHYAGIGRANAILDNLPNANLAETSKVRFEAEARFMRAYFYFNLVRLFGDVQLITTIINDPYGANVIPRTDTNMVYELIISDLQSAEMSLPVTIPAGEAGRASVWAAKALLGKVYLTLSQWDLAAPKLKEVIDANMYNLTAVSYAQTFSPATSYANNKDIIWSVQYKSGLVGQGSALWSSLTPWGSSGPLFGTTGTGEGFMKPTADIISAYEPGDLRKDATLRTSFTNGASVVINEPYVYKYNQMGPQAGDADSDFPLIRYADVLLMYAEALSEQGLTGAAEPFLNQVRARAGLAAITGLSQADFRIAVEKERRLELAFEGHRWFDLVRTGRYLDVMVAKGFPVQVYHRLYPIPQREADLNPLLEGDQNEGY